MRELFRKKEKEERNSQGKDPSTPEKNSEGEDPRTFEGNSQGRAKTKTFRKEAIKGKGGEFRKGRKKSSGRKGGRKGGG